MNLFRMKIEDWRSDPLFGFCRMLRPDPLVRRLETRVLPLILLILGLLLIGILRSDPIYGQEKKKEDVKIKVKEFKEKINDKQLHKKLEAIKELSESKEKEAKETLFNEMKTTKDKYIKRRIIESFVNNQDKTVSDEIVYTLKTDTSTDVRYTSAYVLGYSKDQTAIPVLIETFLNEKEDIGVRLQSANALTNHPPNEEIYQCFIKGLENTNPTIRVQAITSMSLSFGGLNRHRIVPILRKLLNDKDEIVRNIAKERLEIFGINK